MNIHHNQEPPRKRSRDQQHTSTPTTSSSMIGGNEKGNNNNDTLNTDQTNQPVTSAGLHNQPPSSSTQPTTTGHQNNHPPTSATPWSWFRRHHRQSQHHGQPSSSSSGSSTVAAVASSSTAGTSLPPASSSGHPLMHGSLANNSGNQFSSQSSTSSNTSSIMNPGQPQQGVGAMNTGAPIPTAVGSNNNPVDATSGTSNIPSFAAVSMVTSDTEPDEIEMSRLQAILEARGVPPHLLGALGPRMQTLLHRTIGSSSSSKAHQLVQGLKAHGDEGQQLQTVMEMCQLLVMGNEDTLAGFPVKLAVPNLIQLLNMEHNFDIMNHACRALTYMMESLPRSASVVVDAVPSFLEKLQVIQCMDVAEQSLTALEMLSRRHSRAILHARGVSACLTYLDFFSINAQRSALTIAANCCQNITPEEFTFIQDSLVTLSSHLTSTDKKSVESIILAFSRLVEHYQDEPTILMEVAGGNLLDNLTQLLLATPSVISINTFVMIIRMMALMCQSCPDLAVKLLTSDIVSTIRYLLVGQKSSSSNNNKSIASNDAGTTSANISTSSLNETSNVSSNISFSKLNESVELLNRTPRELYEITSLIAELMPRLATDGIFAVNALLDRENNPSQESVVWQWRDDRGIWHRYSAVDNKLIDSAHRAGDEEITLVTMGKTYTIDFTTMQQINEETELSRPVQRKVNHQQPQTSTNPLDQGASCSLANDSQKTNETNHDPRVDYIKKNPSILEHFAQSLFGVLYEIYSSSAGCSVRHKCLSAFLRIIYYSPTEALRHLLRCHPVSSHIAAMLASADQRILVGAIQMALILIDKLPDIFSVYFRREGVMHQFKRLANKSSSSLSNKKEEVKDWIVKQAKTFEERTGESLSGDSRTAMDILNKLTCAIEMLDDRMVEALQQLKSVLADGDISSFELIHSGLVSKLVKFLTSVEGDSVEDRDNRIRAFLSVFLGLPQDPRHMLLLLNEYELKIDPQPMSTLVTKLNACISQLEQFPVRVHDFVGLGNGSTRGASALKFFNTHQLKCNLQRHPQCSNLRQWKGGPVKIDPLAIVQAIEKYLTVRGYAKIRDSADNSDDNSGDEMDDSMTMMTQPSGRHRLQLSIGDQVLPYNMTVYQAIRQFGGSNIMGNNLEMEESDLQVVGHSNMWTETHTIYYRPYVESQPGASTSSAPVSQNSSASSSTVYLTKRMSRSQTASTSASGASDLRLSSSPTTNPYRQDSSTDTATSSLSKLTNEAPGAASSANITTSCPPQQSSLSGRRYNTRNSSSSLYSSHYHRTPVVRKKVDDLWSEGKTPSVVSPIDSYLSSKLPQSVTLKDPSVEIIVLLRAIFGLNRHWSWFYRDGISFNTHQVISNNEFINTKLAAKATRQLQDPLVIMTGNLPNWLPQLAYACPFLIPFDTRQLLFYVTCFDRDRALQRLLDTTPELSNSEERVAPRLERRKKTVNREDLFRQSEIILNELTNSKTVLEIQYENEVGTGLGPTLEFYALVSREMQNAEFEMWRGEIVPASQSLIQSDPSQYNRKEQASTSITTSDSIQDETNWNESENISCADERFKSDTSKGNNNNIYVKGEGGLLNKFNKATSQSKGKLATPPPPPVQPVAVEQSKKYIYSPSGLFPMPIARNTKLGSVSRLRNRYKLLGKFIAKALMDSRMIDINFSLPFYKWLLSQEVTLDLADMAHIDPTMSRSLFHMHRIAQLYNIMNAHKAREATSSAGSSHETRVTTAKSMDKLRQQVGSQANQASIMLNAEDLFANISPEVLTLDGCPIEDLNLDFTLPGYSSIELKKGGKYILTKLENLDQYVKLLRHWTLTEGVRRQMEAFRAGFEAIVPLHYLRIFYPEELDSLFCGSGYQNWDVRMLMDACKTDHGFSHESIQIKYLFEILSSYNADEQRKFLQFITGSPRLPYGGLKSLSPPLTIVRKTLEPGQNPDHFLPSVMTCVNYLKLPEYSSCEIMREKLRISGEEGRNAFHLS